MLAKQKTGRAAAGKGHALHLKEGNDVLIEPAIVFELIGEIEDDVWGEAGELLPQKIEIVEYREMLRRTGARAELELVAAFDQPRQELVHTVFLFIGPLTD